MKYEYTDTDIFNISSVFYSLQTYESLCTFTAVPMLLQCPLHPLALWGSQKSQGSTDPAQNIPVLCSVCLPELFCLQDWSARGSASFTPWNNSPPMCVSAFVLRGCHCSYGKRWHHPVGGTAWSLKRAPTLLPIVEGRSFLQSLSRTCLPNASINGSLVTWLIQANYGGWGSVVHLPNASQG